jgi:hypothetical protein
MQTATVKTVTPLVTAAAHFPEQAFQPLERETRPAINTEAAAYYLNRKPQTLRAWACLENGPIRPVRINGRLAWPVPDIKRLLSGEEA